MRVNQKSVIKQTSLRSTNKMILDRKIVKTNMQDDGFNKMCKYRCAFLNLKYTDAITQLRRQSLYNQYYDQQIQDSRRTQTRSIVATD